MPDSIDSRTDRVAGHDAGRSQGILDRVRDTATEQLSSQKNRATDGLGSVAQAVRQSTRQLRDEQHDTIAQYVEQAADQIDRFSRRLRDKQVPELIDDVQRLARRQPAAFVGGAFALGLVAARFFKSSSPRSGSRREWQGASSPATSGGGREYAQTPARAGGSAGHVSTVHDYQAPRRIAEDLSTAPGDIAERMESPESGTARTAGGRGTKARRGTQSERS